MFQWLKNIHIHPKQVLPRSWDYLRNSLHYRHWYVVFWLHPYWIGNRLPYLPWGKWAWAACFDHAGVGSAFWRSARTESTKSKLLLIRFKRTNLRRWGFPRKCQDSRFKTSRRHYWDLKWFIFWLHSVVPHVEPRRKNYAFLSFTTQMDNWRLTSQSSCASSTHARSRCALISRTIPWDSKLK